MKQSVNFIKVIHKPVSKLTAMTIGAAGLGLLCLLIVFSMFSFTNLMYSKHRLSSLQKQLEQTQTDYDTLAKAYPLLASDDPIVNQVNLMSQKVAARQAEVDSLKDVLLRRGFSEYMFGVAQAAPANLWINQLQVQHHPHAITISGYSLTHQSVSEFMTRLSKTEAFAEEVFSLFTVKTIKDHPYVRFSIGTAALGPDQTQPIEDPELPGVEVKPEKQG